MPWLVLATRGVSSLVYYCMCCGAPFILSLAFNTVSSASVEDQLRRLRAYPGMAGFFLSSGKQVPTTARNRSFGNSNCTTLEQALKVSHHNWCCKQTSSRHWPWSRPTGRRRRGRCGPAPW